MSLLSLMSNLNLIMVAWRLNQARSVYFNFHLDYINCPLFRPHSTPSVCCAQSVARCRLGSRLCCCLVNACDTSAKKTVAETSKCWTCGGIAYLDHVSKDDELRKRVHEWRKDLSTGRPLKCSLCGKVPKRVVNAGWTRAWRRTNSSMTRTLEKP